MDQSQIIENYRQLFIRHGEGAAVGQWSEIGQRFRFEKLAQVADLRDASVLDIGCGIGDLYPFLTSSFGKIAYTGVDIVPELVSHAARKYPEASFLCRDLLSEPLPGKFDYCLISGVFNNDMHGAGGLLEQLITVAFAACRKALAFNFTSDRVNRHDPGMAYHDPIEVFRFCLEHLSNQVTVAHHYERCDVAIYVRRKEP